MPRITELAVEGQTKVYTINTGFDISTATEIRLYYKFVTSNISGYWTQADGVALSGTTSMTYTHNDIPVGEIRIVPWAKYSDDTIDISPDPVIYKAKALYE